MSLINAHRIIFMMDPGISFDRFHEISTKIVKKVEEYGGDAENILDLGYLKPVNLINGYNLLRYGCISFSGTDDVVKKINKELFFMDDIVTSIILDKNAYNDRILKQKEVKNNA